MQHLIWSTFLYFLLLWSGDPSNRSEQIKCSVGSYCSQLGISCCQMSLEIRRDLCIVTSTLTSRCMNTQIMRPALKAVSQQGQRGCSRRCRAFAPSITCCRYPSVLNDSISVSRWPLKAPTVPTSTIWFQQPNPCVDNLPWKIGRGQTFNYGLAPRSQRLVSNNRSHKGALWKQSECGASSSSSPSSFAPFFVSLYSFVPQHPSQWPGVVSHQC